jgi:hypothetical protein
MTRIPLPDPICQRLAQKAVQYAREDIAGRGWSSRSMGALVTYTPGQGLVGIKTSAKYLAYQNRGFAPFIMWWVDKKGGAIPLGCKAGDGPHFRRGGQAGKPGYVDIPHVGRRWRDQKWRHPGLKPKHFMQDAIVRALNEEKESIRSEIMEALKGGYRG